MPAWIGPGPARLPADLVRNRRVVLAAMSREDLVREYSRIARVKGAGATVLAPRVLIDLIIWLEGDRRG